MLLVVFAVACSSTGLRIEASAPVEPDPTVEAAPERVVRPQPTPTSTPEFELGDIAASATPTATPERAPNPTGPSSPPTAGEPAEPVDLMALYTGVLGTYTVDQVLTDLPAPMPAPAAGVAPLTGLAPAPSPRPAVVVKIDNSLKARPQAGLEHADVVIVQEVEGGLTRFAAIFHSTDVARVGPVRSGRSTDISFLSSLGRPALAYSGANAVFDQLLLQQERVVNYSATRSGGYWRDNTRRAPSNLFTETTYFGHEDAGPPAWFAYSAVSLTPAIPVTAFTASYPAARSDWVWDGTHWLRNQDGAPHLAETGEQLRATNVVVAEVVSIPSGLRDPVGATVPEFVWAGSGRAAVYTAGGRIDGAWVRRTLGDPAVLIDGEGNPIELMPGNTWIEMVQAL